MRKVKLSTILGLSCAVSLLGLGLFFLMRGSQVTQLSCQPVSNGEFNCQLSRRLAGVILVETVQVSQVKAVDLRSECVDTCVYWLNLVTETEAVRLNRFASYSRRGVQRDYETLHAWLERSPPAGFVFVGSVSWLLLIMSLPLLAIALFLGWLYARPPLKDLFLPSAVRRLRSGR